MSKELRERLFNQVKLNPVKEMPDYGKDPEVQRLTEEARQFLKEHPIPVELQCEEQEEED